MPIAAILFPIVLFGTVLVVSSLYCFKPKGWFYAWIYLFCISGIFRLLLWSFPAEAPTISSLIVVVGAVFVSFRFFRVKKIEFKVQFGIVALTIVGLFIFMRHLFPTYDTDSLAYHLQGLFWFFHRDEYPKMFSNVALVDIRIYWLAFEEYLSVPGLRTDLLLYSGVLTGVIKSMSILTVLSMVFEFTRQFLYEYFFVPLVCIFLFLIDDHFFFSGTSRYIYMNPSLVGTIPLTFWFAYRGARGHSESAWLAVVMGFVMGGTKVMVFFVQGLLMTYLFVSLFLRIREQKISLKQIMRSCPIGLVFIVIFFWATPMLKALIDTGTPFPPMKFGPFHTAFEYYGGFFAFVSFKRLPILAFLKVNHIMPMVWPGNLSLKIAAVLLILFTVLTIVKRKLGFLKTKIDWRLFRLSTGGIVLSAVWIYYCNYLVPMEARLEGRYPRLIFGVTVFSIGIGILAVRKLFKRMEKPLMVKKILPAFGALLIIIVFKTIDTRYFNVAPFCRPTWSDIFKYNRLILEGRTKEFSGWLPLFYEFSQRNMTPLKDCL